MFEDYLAGFFDGEGSFIIRFVPDKRYKTGFQVKPRINITQKDKKILLKIQKTFKMGKIYFHNRDKIWYYNIQKFRDMLKFISIMKKRMIVKKNKGEKFEICLVMIINKEHLTPEGLGKIRMIWLTPETAANT